MSLKDNHSPLAGPCLQQLGEALKCSTTSSSPALQGGRWSQDSASCSGLHHHKALQQWPLGIGSNPTRPLQRACKNSTSMLLERTVAVQKGKLDHTAQHMASHPTVPANLMFENTLCQQNDKKFLYSFTHWFYKSTDLPPLGKKNP